MDEELYDEFGNYVGPGLSSSSSSDEVAVENGEDGEVEMGEVAVEVEDEADGIVEDVVEEEAAAGEEDAGNAIVLAEDKKYYPTAEEVFGEGTEAMVEEEDAQAITEPIIAPTKKKEIDVLDREMKDGMKTLYDVEYLAGALLNTPELIRNVAVVGHLHHGKTTLMDLLFERTHETNWSPDVEVHYTDTRRDEIERGLSTKMTPVTFLLPDMIGKSYAVNIIDAPGHVNFFDEAIAAMYLCDGVIIVVDAAEGVMSGTILAIKHALSQQLAITLVISKVDRLILELRLPPVDAYHKLKYIIDEFNEVVAANTTDSSDPLVLSPDLGNVCFSSAAGRWLFSLEQFAEMYLEEHPDVKMPPNALARRLWGDVWYDRSKRIFTKTLPPINEDTGEPPARSFVEFVLEPLYKLYSMIVGDDVDVLAKKMHKLGIMQMLRRSELRLDVKPLFKVCLGAFFDSSVRGIGEMIAKHIPSAASASKVKVDRLYTGPLDSEVATTMSECDSLGPTVVMVSKLLSTTDAESFLAVGRIMSGKLQTSSAVRVLGEGYNPDFDDEDQALSRVGRIYLSGGRYRVEVRSACAGQIVLIEDVADTIIKSATIVAADSEQQEEMYIYRPLSSLLSSGVTAAVVRVAIEPLRPSELPKMVEGVRKCIKSYPALQTRVEESGEHVLLATGELSLDCVLNELRDIYAEVEIKVSDPCVPFAETVSETSSLKCFAETPNKQNKLTMIAEPLEEGLAEYVESGALSGFDSDDVTARKSVQKELRNKFGWDVLAAKSLWAFGPNSRNGPNCLVDDVLPGGLTDKSMMALARDSIVQGFQWSTREGPLCDEPVRGVKYRILEAIVSDEPISRSGAQVIPTARRVSYSAFLTATPRLMEPVYNVEILCPADCVAAVYNILARRRGFVVEDVPKVGTPLFLVKASLPVLDSFGFESDLRLFTQGQAFCLQWFDHWAVMPGDPIDKDIHLVPLQPSPSNALARECMVKTRRRKGMSEDISIGKYFDDPLLLELAQQDMNGE